MRIQRNDATSTDIWFESKIQSTMIYKEWAIEVFSVQNIADILSDASVTKAVDVSLDISIIRSHVDLELLISRWRIKTPTFITTWREFSPTLEDVSVMSRLSVLAARGDEPYPV